ncbi:MAG: ribosome recycling factor [Planctomycetota bacterium]
MSATEIIIKNCDAGMKKCLDRLSDQFKKIRAGRATTDMLDPVKVEYYGSMVPINQTGSVTVSDALTLLVKPFERKFLQDIERAVHKANLGFTVSNDGVAVRVSLPPLNEERRRGMAGEAKGLTDEAKVQIRFARREGIEALEKGKKDKAFSEDDFTRAKEQVEKMLKAWEKKADDALKVKTDELMKI